MKKYQYALALMLSFALINCKSVEKKELAESETNQEIIIRNTDGHSHANVHEIRTSHLHLDLAVDFAQKKLKGSVLHKIEHLTQTDTFKLDARDLHIKYILLDERDTASYFLGNSDDLLGQELAVIVNEETQSVKVYYETSPEAGALQWLSAQLTADKNHPFMFTQGQAILSRTWIPCQDTPLNRLTYSANISTPAELMAVMSADNPTERNEEGNYHFEMNKPIPTYLIALAVGDIGFKAIGENTGVYAEQSMLNKSAYEFAEVDEMIVAAESLYGPYKWGRYDILVLPPSFPYGGMENPKLTFATPTILAGDRSLVSLIAHELAHSWSGNLVTNATWEDFWLNEGFTVYFENRIMEKVYDKDYADMLMSIEYQELMRENQEFLNSDYPEDTQLKLDLEGRDPDDGMTSIAYVKGALFLMKLEELVGRENFDAFLNQYFADYSFKTISTEEFLSYLDKNLMQKHQVKLNIDDWVYGQGIPNNCIEINSTRFDVVDKKVIELYSIENIADLGITKKDWSSHEWIRFIRRIPDKVDADLMEKLDDYYGFSSWGNSEIMAEWYLSSIQKGYHGMEPDMRTFLVNVGRRKFLEPIYTELAKTPEGFEMANEIYVDARPNYHSITYNTIDEILNWD
jgi:leukotriene-A4 hydrolase